MRLDPHLGALEKPSNGSAGNRTRTGRGQPQLWASRFGFGVDRRERCSEAQSRNIAERYLHSGRSRKSRLHCRESFERDARSKTAEWSQFLMWRANVGDVALPGGTGEADDLAFRFGIEGTLASLPRRWIEENASEGKTHRTISSDLGGEDDPPTLELWKFLQKVAPLP